MWTVPTPPSFPLAADIGQCVFSAVLFSYLLPLAMERTASIVSAWSL